jgi:hypothetical protein
LIAATLVLRGCRLTSRRFGSLSVFSDHLTMPRPTPRTRNTIYERRAWRVKAQIVQYKLEDDSDIHLILFWAGRYMIAEMPFPAACRGRRATGGRSSRPVRGSSAAVGSRPLTGNRSARSPTSAASASGTLLTARPATPETTPSYTRSRLCGSSPDAARGRHVARAAMQARRQVLRQLVSLRHARSSRPLATELADHA